MLTFSELGVTDTHMPWENPVLCILCYVGKKVPDQMFSDKEFGLCRGVVVMARGDLSLQHVFFCCCCCPRFAESGLSD